MHFLVFKDVNIYRTRSLKRTPLYIFLEYIFFLVSNHLKLSLMHTVPEMSSLITTDGQTKVFTARVLIAFKRLIRNKQVTHSVLCEWHDKKGKVLVHTKSSFQKCMFFFAGSLSAIYAVYLAFQMVAQLIWNTGESKNFVNIFWTFLWGLYYWWATGNNLNIFVRQDDADTFIGGMVQLDSHFESTYSLLLSELSILTANIFLPIIQQPSQRNLNLFR